MPLDATSKRMLKEWSILGLIYGLVSWLLTLVGLRLIDSSLLQLFTNALTGAFMILGYLIVGAVTYFIGSYIKMYFKLKNKYEIVRIWEVGVIGSLVIWLLGAVMSGFNLGNWIFDIFALLIVQFILSVLVLVVAMLAKRKIPE